MKSRSAAARRSRAASCVRSMERGSGYASSKFVNKRRARLLWRCWRSTVMWRFVDAMRLGWMRRAGELPWCGRA